ncbi:MAG: hypothetical protein LBI65_01375 [Candidatus Symbiothrix sp.]|jgi:hypothetical protein|nr:hypothetical protein [Candidatus Symbiothrix sp.]
MDNLKETGKREGQKLALFIFECVMAVLYLFIGIVFLFTSFYIYLIDGTVRIALGIVFGLYGIFRIYRALKKLF